VAGLKTIQRFPRGLLHALAMKGSGDAPNQLSEAVLGTFALDEYYLADNSRVVFGQTANITVPTWWPNTSSACIVPAGEMWIVRNLSVWSGAFATGGYIVPGYQRKIATTANYCLITAGAVNVPAAVGQYVACGVQFQTNALVLYPGDTVGVTSSVAIGINVSFALDIYRIEL